MKNLLLTLLLLPALAAAKVPVEEDIVAKTSDPDSPFYYTSLMMRYNAGDETLTDEDYHYLYYGYAYRDEYKPLAVNPDLDKMLMLASGIDPDKPDRATLETMVSMGNDALKRDPFSPKILNLMSFAYGALGDKEQEKAWSDRMLDVLAAEGLSFGKARIVSRTVEFVPLVVPYVVEGKKRKGFYFDFSRVYWNKPEGYTYQRDRTWQFNNLKPRTYK